MMSRQAIYVSLLSASFALVTHAKGAASDADKTFVGNVSQGGMYEVEASKVAEQRATAPDVKDLAHTEVHDHDGVNAGLKKIADAAGISIATELNPMFQERLDKLKNISAEKFDAAYIQDMRSIHDKDEKLFAKEAEEGSDDFRVFAHETDQIVKRHIGALHGAN